MEIFVGGFSINIGVEQQSSCLYREDVRVVLEDLIDEANERNSTGNPGYSTHCLMAAVIKIAKRQGTPLDFIFEQMRAMNAVASPELVEF